MDLEWVNEMHAKHEHLTDKLMLVSASGFTKNADDTAEKYGIETLTLQEAQSADWTKVVGKLPQVFVALPELRPAGVRIAWAEDSSKTQPPAVDVDSVFHDPVGKQQATLIEIAHSALRVPEVLKHAITTYPDPGDYAFNLAYTPPDGSYILDGNGVAHKVKGLDFRVEVHVAERIPVDLHHHSYQGAQVAFGTLSLPDQQGLLTVVESTDRPLSADLRLSPNRELRKPTGKKPESKGEGERQM